MLRRERAATPKTAREQALDRRHREAAESWGSLRRHCELVAAKLSKDAKGTRIAGVDYIRSFM